MQILLNSCIVIVFVSIRLDRLEKLVKSYYVNVARNLQILLICMEWTQLYVMVHGGSILQKKFGVLFSC